MSSDPDSVPSHQDKHSLVPSGQRARLTAGVVLGGVGLAFALVNLGSVKVDWIVGSAHSPLILVIVVSVLIGAGVDRAVLWRTRKRSKSPHTE